ncbi:MAG: alpha/beta fold hydrolase [Acidimicrobiales bacterium]|nr:alpha/beta fold hydrolase [Acidimicrobiales bacterium]MCB9372710.1 alpha/beta fold hydrolase [Microthrixaceae bacterium]
MTAPIIPGAEPWSADGTNGHGALVLHGFTGNCNSMRGLAEAFHRAGYAVELPLLPGHGTSVEDMLGTHWGDWSSAVEAVYESLASRCDRVVVVGLSMGGSLTCWLATRHPEIAGIVCINPATQVSIEMRELVEQMVVAGESVMPGIGSDIADPEATESAYEGTPVQPLLSLFDAAEEFGSHLDRITCPLLLFTSPEDHVVPPTDSDHLAAHVSGPVERVTCERSYHVATLDYDKGLIEERAVAFADKVTAS